MREKFSNERYRDNDYKSIEKQDLLHSPSESHYHSAIDKRHTAKENRKPVNVGSEKLTDSINHFDSEKHTSLKSVSDEDENSADQRCVPCDIKHERNGHNSSKESNDLEDVDSNTCQNGVQNKHLDIHNEPLHEDCVSSKRKRVNSDSHSDSNESDCDKPGTFVSECKYGRKGRKEEREKKRSRINGHLTNKS